MIKTTGKITPLDFWIRNRINPCSGNALPKDLAMYQMERIRETVGFACERSIFYRRHLKDFAELNIFSFDDFASFPFTSETDIRNNALQMLCVSQDAINRVVTLDSSGTTGSPKRVYFTTEDQELTIDFFIQGMSTLTLPGDRVMILLPCERPGSVGDLLAEAVIRFGAIPVKYGVVRDIAGALNIISEFNVNVIVGIPVQLLALARFYELNRETEIHVRGILLSTDYVSAGIVSELERIFGCEVFNHYGMTEMGLGGAIDCCSHSGYHLREADLYFEIVDPDSGKILPDGEYGEVVFTTLTRNGMPLIRYRTGDMSRFIPGDCPCGTGLRRMDYIRYRINSMIVLHGGYMLGISELDESLLKIDGIVDYKASCFKHDGVTVLEIKVIKINQPVNEQEVYNGLSMIQGVYESMKNGILEIKVVSEICCIDYIPGTGKRKISFHQY